MTETMDDMTRKLINGLFAGDNQMYNTNRANLGNVLWIEVQAIHPSPEQARREISEASIEEMARSIRARGQICPILVKRRGDCAKNLRYEFEMIDGHRRLLACKQLGERAIKALILGGDLRGVALVANAQRQDLKGIELADAIAATRRSLGFSVKNMAWLLGKSEVFVEQAERIAQLPETEKAVLATAGIAFSTVYELAKLDGPARTKAVAAIAQGERPTRLHMRRLASGEVSARDGHGPGAPEPRMRVADDTGPGFDTPPIRAGQGDGPRPIERQRVEPVSPPATTPRPGQGVPLGSGDCRQKLAVLARALAGVDEAMLDALSPADGSLQDVEDELVRVKKGIERLLARIEAARRPRLVVTSRSGDDRH